MGFFSRKQKSSSSSTASSSPLQATESKFTTGGSSSASSSLATLAGPKYGGERSSTPRSSFQADDARSDHSATSRFNPFRLNKAKQNRGASQIAASASTTSSGIVSSTLHMKENSFAPKDRQMMSSPTMTTTSKSLDPGHYTTMYKNSTSLTGQSMDVLPLTSSSSTKVNTKESRRQSSASGFERWNLFNRSTNTLQNVEVHDDEEEEESCLPLPIESSRSETNLDSSTSSAAEKKGLASSASSRWKLPNRRASSSGGIGTDGGFVVQSIRNVSRVQDTEYESRPTFPHNQSSTTSSTSLHRRSMSISPLPPFTASFGQDRFANSYETSSDNQGSSSRPPLNVRTASVPGANSWREGNSDRPPSPTMISVEAFRQGTRPSSRTSQRVNSNMSISSMDDFVAASSNERPRFEPTSKSRRSSFQSLNSGETSFGLPRPAFALTGGSNGHSRSSTSSSIDSNPHFGTSSHSRSQTMPSSHLETGLKANAASKSQLSVASFMTAPDAGSTERRPSSTEAEDRLPQQQEYQQQPHIRRSASPTLSPGLPASTSTDSELRLIAMYASNPSSPTGDGSSLVSNRRNSRSSFYFGGGSTTRAPSPTIASSSSLDGSLAAWAHSPQTPIPTTRVQQLTSASHGRKIVNGDMEEKDLAPVLAVQPPTPQSNPSSVSPARRGQVQNRRMSSGGEVRTPSRMGQTSARGKVAWGSDDSDSDDDGRVGKEAHRFSPIKKGSSNAYDLLAAKKVVLNRDEEEEEDDDVPLAQIKNRSSTDLTSFYASKPDSHSSGLDKNVQTPTTDIEILAEPRDKVPQSPVKSSKYNYSTALSASTSTGRSHGRAASAGATSTMSFSSPSKSSALASPPLSPPDRLTQNQRSISALALAGGRPSPLPHNKSSPALPVPNKLLTKDGVPSIAPSASRSVHPLASALKSSPSKQSLASSTLASTNGSNWASSPSALTTNFNLKTTDSSPAISDLGTSQSQDTLVNSIASTTNKDRATSKERSPVVVKFKDLPLLDDDDDWRKPPVGFVQRQPLQSAPRSANASQFQVHARRTSHQTYAPSIMPPRSNSSLGFHHDSPTVARAKAQLPGKGQTTSAVKSSEAQSGQSVFDRMKQRHRAETTKAIQLGKDLNGREIDEEDVDDQDDEAPLSSLPNRNMAQSQIGSPGFLPPSPFAPQKSYGGFSPLAMAPPGVDQHLYSALPNDQKMQLHQRSQQMMQMMAQAALQARAESVMNADFSEPKPNFSAGVSRSGSPGPPTPTKSNLASPRSLKSSSPLPSPMASSPYGYLAHSQSMSSLQLQNHHPLHATDFYAPPHPSSPYGYAAYGNMFAPGSSPTTPRSMMHSPYSPSAGYGNLLPPGPQYWGGGSNNPYLPPSPGLMPQQQHKQQQQVPAMYTGSMMGQPLSSIPGYGFAFQSGTGPIRQANSMIDVRGGARAGARGARRVGASTIGTAAR